MDSIQSPSCVRVRVSVVSVIVKYPVLPPCVVDLEILFIIIIITGWAGGMGTTGT